MFPTPLALENGQQRALYLRAGSLLHVQRGSVELSAPPQWLGEQLVGGWQRLEAGEALALEYGGWVQLQAACAGSQVHIEAAPSRLALALEPVLTSARGLAPLLGWAGERCTRCALYLLRLRQRLQWRGA